MVIDAHISSHPSYQVDFAIDSDTGPNGPIFYNVIQLLSAKAANMPEYACRVRAI